MVVVVKVSIVVVAVVVVNVVVVVVVMASNGLLNSFKMNKCSCQPSVGRVWWKRFRALIKDIEFFNIITKPGDNFDFIDFEEDDYKLDDDFFF